MSSYTQFRLFFNKQIIHKFACIMVALLLTIVSAQAFFMSRTSAALLGNSTTPRSIQFSRSDVSATGVSAIVNFYATSTAQSIVIDFCGASPIIGTACTAPTGMATSSPTITTVSGGGNVQGGGAWTVVSGSAGTLKLAKGSGSAISALSSNSFQINNIQNPSSTGAFYARITTYAQAAWTDGATAYSSPTVPGGYADYGGVALYTVSAISISATVQETLTFCVVADPTSALGNVPGDDCANAGTRPPNITIGHSSGSQTIIDQTAVDFKNIFTQLSTNALNGADIYLKNVTACSTNPGGMSADGGTTCGVAPKGSSAGSIASGSYAANYPSGSFGLCVIPSTVAAPAGSATYSNGTNAAAGDTVYNGINSVAPYNSTCVASPTATLGSNTNAYAMDGNGTTGTTSTFGQKVATTAKYVYRINNIYNFSAIAGPTTPAGNYSATLNLISVGKF